MQTAVASTTLQQPRGAQPPFTQVSLEQQSTSYAPAWDHTQRSAIAEAIREAMETTHRDVRSRSRPRPSVESPRDLLPAPQPHLPLRKASAQRLQTRKGGAPRPQFAPSGIRPSPVQPLPYIDNVNASNEHAFAGRDPRRPFKPPLGNFVDPLVNQYRTADASQRSPILNHPDGRPPSSPLLPPPPAPHSPRAKGKSLRNARSVGDGPRGLRKKPNTFASMSYGGGVSSGYNAIPPLPSPPMIGAHAIRDSYRSAVTSHSSFAATSTSGFTDRSSMTPHSSQSDAAPGGCEGGNFTFLRGPSTDEDEGGESATDYEVDDLLGMYEDGFSSTGRPSCDVRSIRSADRSVMEKNSLDVRSFHTPERLDSQANAHRIPPTTKRAHTGHRRSQSASMLLGVQKARQGGGSAAVSRSGSVTSPPGRSFSDSRTLNLSNFPARDITSAPQPTAIPRATQNATTNRISDSTPVPRDRYGFKKVSHYVTAAQYDAWDSTYTPHLERRARKWHVLMRSYGLSVTPAFRFPPKSDKIKRYVRKGIPLEYRGAAWFWYAGGPGVLAKDKGLYAELCKKVENGALGETDREHIERDLNRTFPDNVKFKPDPSSGPKGGHAEGRGNVDSAIHLDDAPAIALNSAPPPAEVEVETPIVQSLRRVLQAFAVHNPHIGYCQSLNFIAGLLLLFLDEDEEKTFILLNIVTHTHLPGTHGVALEGANVDIAVLMSCVKDSLPAVWAKLDDKGGGMDHGSGGALRLPTVSLATTAWFMSLFVGTLPIEAVLRIWDCLFFEGSKTLFRVALAIFKFAEPAICSVADPMEIFQLVQQVPRALLDVNALLEVCFRRRAGFAGISQGLIEGRREDRRKAVKDGVRRAIGGTGLEQDEGEGEGRLKRFTRRVRSRTGTAK